MNFNDIYWHDSYLEEIALGTSLKSDERVFKMKEAIHWEDIATLN